MIFEMISSVHFFRGQEQFSGNRYKMVDLKLYFLLVPCQTEREHSKTKSH